MKRKNTKLSLTLIAIIFCCALAILPTFFTILYYNKSISNQFENTAHETASFYLDQFADKSTSILNTLRNSIYYLMSDAKTQSIMRSTSQPDQLDRLEVEEGLSQAFFLGDNLDSSIVNGIYLVKDGRQYLSVLYGGYYTGNISRIQKVYEECKTLNSARDLYTLPEFPDYCYFVVNYLDLNSKALIGKIIIELDSANLVDTSYIDSMYDQAVVTLRSDDGRLLFGTSDNAAFSDVDFISPGNYVSVDGTDYYQASRALSPSRIHINLFVPKSEIFEVTDQMIYFLAIFTAVILIITLLAGAFVLYLIYQPVRQMMSSIDRLASGDLSARMVETPYRETEHMVLTFNDMAHRLEELFDEVYQKGLLLREAEFNLLESQIRPHFIFNVLEIINVKCLERGQNDICCTVSNLAELLRANIVHKHEQIISLQEELKYVEYYLALQKERFDEKLTCSIDIEIPELLQYELPKLTIQPLIENSIVHGIEPKRGGGDVGLRIWEEDDALYIRVTDNGVGFDASVLDLSIPDTAETGATNNHIAIANIDRRIKLLYGSQYGLSIVSSPGRGCCITVTLPIQHTQG
ncbi:sensor histidine kinase [Ruminococcus gauvreauii]|uniref:Sensor histidine kinase n=1 Tax=Ruminococcus gauvreauii TaxID=438033 RepID=A0ABY5VCI8_9FIRM|nr:sensor histidine kinase [Ruminococcus gauvreauii]UWP57892.1 sensor histidine kinase [Ruminococcus gauvreauii]